MPAGFTRAQFAAPIAASSPLIQSASGTFNSASPQTATFSQANTLGNLIVVMTAFTGSLSNNTTGITDTAGNSYTLADAEGANGSSGYCDIWYCLSCKSAASGNIVSAAYHGGTITDANMSICEFSAVSPFAAGGWSFDASSTNSSSFSESQPSLAASPTQNNELILWNLWVSTTGAGPTGGITADYNQISNITDTSRTLFTEWAQGPTPHSSKTATPIVANPGNALAWMVCAGFYT
jgi:hypothetical protein